MNAAIARGPRWGLLYDPGLVACLDVEPGPGFVAALRARAAAGVAGRGRGEVVFIDAGEGQWVLRHYRRGGLVGRMVSDRYAWSGAEQTRCFREWRMLARLHAQGLPVPQPVAAAFQRQGLCYRADLVTRRIAGAEPLSARLAAGAAVDWRGIGATLARFHAAGACHADLNAHNVLLDAAGHAWLLDFDRGRFRAAGRWKERNLARLERSLRKIAREPGAPDFSKEGWEALLAGYGEGLRLRRRLRAKGP